MWNKLMPDGAAALNVGDNTIRENMDALEDALSREHTFPGTLGTTAGRHSFPMPDDSTELGAISNPVDGMIAGRTDIPVLFMRQSGIFVPIYGYHYDTKANRLAFSTSDLPDGFIWIESDTGNMWQWDGSGWVLVTPLDYAIKKTASTADMSPSADDTWELITGLSQAIPIPNDGVSYQVGVELVIPWATYDTVKAAVRLQHTSGPTIIRWSPISHPSSTGASMAGESTIKHVDIAPTPGATYTYEGWFATGDKARFQVNPTESGFFNYSGLGNFTAWADLIVSIHARRAP